jgi:hypothetical protein
MVVVDAHCHAATFYDERIESAEVEDTASDDFRRTVESLPDLNIVIGHLGCRREDTTPPHMMYRRVLALAQYYSTFMKVPGLGEICQRPARFPQPSAPFENIPPVIEKVGSGTLTIRPPCGAC